MTTFQIETFLIPLISSGPQLFVFGLAAILYFSRREERPRASLLVLISTVISMVTMVAQPVVWGLASQFLQTAGEDNLSMFMVMAALFNVPAAISTALLVWAAYMSDPPARG